MRVMSAPALPEMKRPGSSKIRKPKGCSSGSKRLRHPVVGELELDYEVMDVSADDGLTIAVYSVEPSSRSAEALDLLASWTATPHEQPTTAEP